MLSQHHPINPWHCVTSRFTATNSTLKAMCRKQTRGEQLTCILAYGGAEIRKCISISLRFDTEMLLLFLPQERSAASAEVWSVICTLALFGELRSNICYLIEKSVPEQLWSLRGFQNCITLPYTRRLLIYYTAGNRRAGLACYAIDGIQYDIVCWILGL